MSGKGKKTHNYNEYLHEKGVGSKIEVGKGGASKRDTQKHSQIIPGRE